MDRQYLKTPFYGSRKMKAWLLQQVLKKSSKADAVESAICRRPNAWKPAPGHRPAEWRLIGSTRSGPRTSPTSPWRRASCTWWPSWTTAGTCWPGSSPTPWTPASAWRRLGKGRPEIFNTDQGSQFTSDTQTLQEQRVQVSMDGKGRYLDNIFVEPEHQVRGGVSESLPDRRRGPNWDSMPTWSSTTGRGLTRLWATGPQKVYQHGQEERGAELKKQGCHRAW